MDNEKKGKIIGAVGTLLVCLAVIVLLILITIKTPIKEELGGIPVMMGNVDAANGLDDPSLVDVDVMTEPEVAANAEPETVSEQDLMTQKDEETVALKPKAEKEKKIIKTKEIKKPQKSAEEKAAEAKRLQEAKEEQARKEAAEAAKRRVAGAFGKGAQMGGNKGTATSGQGVEGSRDGNSSTGAKSGSPGYGTFDLGGRSIGNGGLPRPAYNVQEEGRVVVTITVSPSGEVIATSINRKTNTVSPALRKAAEDAAKRARFNSVQGVNNQVGTITYYFKLR
ncbi:MAG: energy transducer TonB [Bacteroides sp.]